MGLEICGLKRWSVVAGAVVAGVLGAGGSSVRGAVALVDFESTPVISTGPSI
jgi:hypothetical protein